MGQGETVVCNLTQVKNGILANNADRTEEYLSTQEEFPARIAKNIFCFFSFARIWKVLIS